MGQRTWLTCIETSEDGLDTHERVMPVQLLDQH